MVESGGECAMCGAARLELCVNRAGAGDDRGRQAGQLRDGKAVAAVDGAFGDLMQEDQFPFPFAGAVLMEREGGQAHGAAGPPVIMRSDTATAPVAIPHTPPYCPDDDEAALGGGGPAAPREA